MKLRIIVPIVIIIFFGLMVFKPWQHAYQYPAKGKVYIEATDAGYELIRDGSPYHIKGASVVDMTLLHKIKESGGNSIRLYDTHNARPILDSAYKLGLTVTLGLRLQQARMEMDYSDKEAVARQLDTLRKEVLQYKDHPALLMWAVGNETTLFIPSRYSNFFQIRRVLKAVDDVAAMIHEVDPDHPTTMVLANVQEPVIRIANMVCRNIDLLSFNIFSPLNKFLPKIAYCGWKGPYIITEFGAKGYWSTKRTEWHSRVEQTSLQKAQYLQAQFKAISKNKSHCLGAYVFIWGTKQEYTPTWFSLFSPWPKLQETELTETCMQEWKGISPNLLSPSIDALTINGASDTSNIYVQPGTTPELAIYLANKVQGPLLLRWELAEEVAEYLSSSYKSQKPKIIADSTWKFHQEAQYAGNSGGRQRITFRFKTPDYNGPFRIYLYAVNKNGKASTANASFFVHKN